MSKKQSLPLLALSAMVMLSGFGFGLAQAQTAGTEQKSSTHCACKGKHVDGQHHGQYRHRDGYKKMMESLNLTPEQKEKFKAAREQFKKDNAAAIANMKAKHKELKALGTDSASEQRRQQLKAELKADWQALKAKKKVAMQGILTPEQTAKMEAMKQEWHQKHSQKYEKAK